MNVGASSPLRWRGLGVLAAVAVLVAAAVGVFGASAAPPTQSDATAVTAWNSFAVTTLVNLPGPAGGAPPASQINMGMVQGAVYDAVNAITPKHHRPYLLTRRFGNTASDDAAVRILRRRAHMELLRATIVRHPASASGPQ